MNKERRKLLLYAIKIALGSSIAIYLAQLMHLEFATSAGSITLLTLVTTKWDTLKLSLYRVITFVMSVFLAGLLFTHGFYDWSVYGVFIFVLVIICCLLGWKSTLSVNAVIATHFLTMQSFDLELVKNECMLVLIGITIAILLNLFHWNHKDEKEIISHMRYTENQLQVIMGELATYLSGKKMARDVWQDIRDMEEKSAEFVQMACEYQGNTFHSHPQYYIDYFEMRLKQCSILHNLHYETKKIRTMPKQAHVVADFLIYLMDYVVELNSAEKQLEKLRETVAGMQEETLPVTREEFESRAILFHILMDLEDFLLLKKRFVDNLDEVQKEKYWASDAK